MCPACLTTLFLVAGGTGSAGGLAALAVKKIKDRRKAPPPAPQPSEKTDEAHRYPAGENDDRP